MPNWTKQQEQAIRARNHTILVSAAAGSGKTAVLVDPLSVASFALSQRIIQKQPAGTFLPASRMFHVEQFHFPDGSSSSGSCSKSGFITSSPADSS